MGGHGALICALRNPNMFRSVSAFAPICNPSSVPWGTKAFSEFLENNGEWAEYDATELARKANPDSFTAPILVDQGLEDNFLETQLKPEAFAQAAVSSRLNVTIRMQEGYDHSYFFISTFLPEHIKFHAKCLVRAD